MDQSLVRISILAARAALVAFGASLAACSSDGGTTPSSGRASVDAVAVNPASSQLGLGSTLQLNVVALDREGNEITGRGTFWASGDTAVASVSDAGLVSARHVGAVQIQAVVDGKPAYSFINVVEAAVDQVSVAPATATVAAGATVKLQAATTDAAGNALADRLVFWQSSNDAVARVTSTGLVSGVAAGSATITATSEGRSATAAVTVTAAPTPPPPSGGGTTNPTPVDSVRITPRDTSMIRGTTARFRATVFAGGKAVTGRTLAWTTTTADVLSVNGTTGEVTANTADRTGDVNVTVEGKTASASVKVLNKPATKIGASAPTQSLQVDQQTTVTATLRDADGNTVSGASATFTSSDPSVLLVETQSATTARVTGKKAGTASVVVGSETAGETRVEFTVTAAPVRTAAVEVSPSTKTLNVNDTQPLTATAKDAQGNALSGRTFAWSSDHAEIAKVDAATGVVTAVAPGTATITAMTENVSGTATITVASPAPAVAKTVEVTPATKSLAVGQTQQLAATARDEGGAALEGRTFQWGSSNEVVATVSATGLVTAAAPGTATITARTEGASADAPVTGTATITVTPAPVDSVRVEPGDTSMVRNTTARFRATVYAGGKVVTDRAVTWSAAPGDVLSVNATGDVTAQNAPNRQGTVTATVEGKTGTATVAVTNKPTTDISLDAPTRTLDVSESTTVTATPRDEDHNAVGGDVSFATSDAAVLTVEKTGPTTAQVVGKSGGTAAVVARVATVERRLDFTVAAPVETVARVVTSPDTAEMREDDRTQFAAETYAASGERLTGRVCAWVTNSPPHATVDSTGLVTAVKATMKGPPIPDGTLLVTATCEGQSGSSTIVITR